jgi:hypothetical protein
VIGGSGVLTEPSNNAETCSQMVVLLGMDQ